MEIIEINKDNLETVTAENGVVVIDCWAPWCPPCRGFAPVFEAFAAKHPEHVFAKLNAESEKALVSGLGVENIPTLLVYRDGVLAFNEAGNFDEKRLAGVLAKVLGGA